MPSEAAHVHLVDNRSRGRMLQERVALPIVSRGIHYHALHCRRAVIVWPPRCVPAVIFWDAHAAAIRVKKDFIAIEPHSVCRIKQPLNSITVDLPGLNLRDEGMP